MTDPRIIRENLTSPDHRYGIITAQVISQYTGTEYEHTGMVIFEGRMDTNNTELYCIVFTIPQQMSSDSATLIVIGMKTFDYLLTRYFYLQNAIPVRYMFTCMFMRTNFRVCTPYIHVRL